MTRALVRLGDKTTSGGEVISATSTIIEGRNISLNGDMAWYVSGLRVLGELCTTFLACALLASGIVLASLNITQGRFLSSVLHD